MAQQRVLIMGAAGRDFHNFNTCFRTRPEYRVADVIVINKIDTARTEDVERVRANIRETNPRALVVDAASPIFVSNPDVVRGRRVLVVEDGPTLTHGEMA